MVCALQEMDRLHVLIDELNVQMYNPMGLHIRWPREVAFLFVSRFFPVRAMVKTDICTLSASLYSWRSSTTYVFCAGLLYVLCV